MPYRPKPLTDFDLDIIRMVARGYTNSEIAQELQLAGDCVRSHIRRLHARLGSHDDDLHGSPASRHRMMAWAYANGLMQGAVEPMEAEAAETLMPTLQPVATAPQLPVEVLPERLAAALEALLGFAEAVAVDRPRGGLREAAVEALRAAGRPVPQQRRAV